jgi:hypothetical protein
MAERKSFLLRVDPALWAELESWAQDELRSVNGQIEFLLKQAVLKRRGKSELDAPPARPTKPVNTSKPSQSAPASPVSPPPDSDTSSGYELLD